MVPFAWVTLAQLDAVSPQGTGLLLHSAFLSMVLLLLCLFIFLVGLVALFFQPTRRLAMACLMGATGYVIGLLMGLNISHDIRMKAFEQLAERSMPLVTAIEKYQGAHGSLPESLNSLVPQFLPEVPATGMAAYPEYNYAKGDDAARFEGNPWVLWVFSPYGGINFDQFIYLPLQNYPEHGYGGVLQRIGDWAYVHE